MVDQRKIFGNRGEDLAASYLQDKGLRVLEQQYRAPIGEIDLICEDGEEIVFVEVKTRKSRTFGYPEESVTPQKLKKIAQVAQWYVREHALESRPFRIDVVAIEMNDGEELKITHFSHV